ncbi:LOW QUALITY PROTEIN: 2-epi-5-epi-valiolone synthase [Polymixia lowei]
MATWTVVFTYKVTETQGLLDPSNDTLLLGHIIDPQQLEDKNSKPLRHFVVYNHKLTGYFEAYNVLCQIFPLPTTEENKYEVAMKILEEVHRFSPDRCTEPIIVGLVASLYRRRPAYIRAPTTLLSYIDASVGERWVNFANCKNKLGTYSTYLPTSAAFLDRSFIQTVPQRHISNGLAEMLKIALMKQRGLFELLETHGQFLLDTRFLNSVYGFNHLEAASLSTMLEELTPDLWEDDLDLNRLVDFGHLINPELEMKVLPSMLHGEAVNIDPDSTMELIQKSLYERLKRLVACWFRSGVGNLYYQKSHF